MSRIKRKVNYKIIPLLTENVLFDNLILLHFTFENKTTHIKRMLWR